MKRALAVTTLALVSLALSSCGGGKTGGTLRPNDPNAKDALKEPASSIKECKPAPGEPLVVDLKSNERSDFELAMNDGIAVVSYNCKELHLLKSCTLHGQKYKFHSVSVKEDVVQLASRDEVEANIPITGAKLSAALASGSTLELALITVGKKRYNQIIFHDQLSGDCDGATHIIRGAYIGAFAMGTGTVGQASAVAEMFGVGAGGSSVSKRKSTTKDGDLDACRAASLGASEPPAACGAITRLDLSPIRPGKNPKPPGGGPDQPPGEPPVAEAPGDPGMEPAPPPAADIAASSKSASSKPGKKTPAKKTPTKKGSPSMPATAMSPSPPPPMHASAAPAPRAESGDVEETPSCPEGLKWNGVVCKKQ